MLKQMMCGDESFGRVLLLLNHCIAFDSVVTHEMIKSLFLLSISSILYTFCKPYIEQLDTKMSLTKYIVEINRKNSDHFTSIYVTSKQSK